MGKLMNFEEWAIRKKRDHFLERIVEMSERVEDKEVLHFLSSAARCLVIDKPDWKGASHFINTAKEYLK
jgi:hypothetical protein